MRITNIKGKKQNRIIIFYTDREYLDAIHSLTIDERKIFQTKAKSFSDTLYRLYLVSRIAERNPVKISRFTKLKIKALKFLGTRLIRGEK